MKTRIIILIIVIKVLTSASVFAQEKDAGIYFKIYGGYSLFAPGSSSAYLFSVPINATGTYSVSKATLGTGANFGFGAGKALSKILIAGIDINYLAGNKLDASSNYSVGFPLLSSAVGAITSASTTTHSVWSITPSISFKVLPKTNYYVYTKLGIIVAVKTNLQMAEKDTIAMTVQAANVGVNSTLTYKYPLQLGIQTAAGMQFRLTNRIKGFVELSANFLTVNAGSAYFFEREFDHRDGKVYIFTETYDKSLKNTGNGGGIPSTSGNITTTNYIVNSSTNTFLPVSQTINNIVLNVGIEVGFK